MNMTPPTRTTESQLKNRIGFVAKGKFLIPAVVAGWSFLTGNENIFPTALVMTLVCLVLLVDDYCAGKETARMSPLGAAGRSALVVFSVPVAIASLAVPAFLPGFAGNVLPATTSDLHGFAYLTAVLLVTCMVCIVCFRLLHPDWRAPAECMLPGRRA